MKPRVYLSHPIRGNCQSKDPATLRAHEIKNIQRAKKDVIWLRMFFPEIDWYCPGEMDEPLQVAFDLGLLDVEQILTIDYHIITDRCHGVLFHYWEQSGGMDGEWKTNQETGNPGLSIFGDSLQVEFEAIHTFVNRVIEQCN